MSEKLITIKEIVQKFKLTPYSVNHYTNLGLLRVVSKKKNKRLYNESEVKYRLENIAELTAQGYPLLLINKKLNGRI